MSVTNSADSGQQSYQGLWRAVAPFIAPPISASAAIIPAFRDMIAKSAQQKGEPVSYMTLRDGLRAGVRAAPTVGAIVGTQMVLQKRVEKMVSQHFEGDGVRAAFASSAVVGTASAPVLAVFNGQTMGWTVRESLRRFSARQGLAIAAQETAFVGGLSAADLVAAGMRRWLGNNRAVDYAAAYLAGAAGSVAGHPANTALTRWQSGLSVDSAQQLMWGSLRKARAVGAFSVVFKLGKEVLIPSSDSK